MSDTPIYDQLCWEYANADFQQRMRRTVAQVQSLFDNHAAAAVQVMAMMRPHFQAAIDAEKRRQEAVAWVQQMLNPAPTRGYGVTFAVIDEMDPRARALSQTNKSYPTSTPSWARKRSR